MALHLPRRRRGACTAGNPATLAADLNDVLAHNAQLGRALLEARQAKDLAEQELARVLDALGRDVDTAQAVGA